MRRRAVAGWRGGVNFGVVWREKGDEGAGCKHMRHGIGKPTFIQPDSEINVSMTTISNFLAQGACVTTFSSLNTSLHGDPIRASQPYHAQPAFVETTCVAREGSPRHTWADCVYGEGDL